MPFKPVFAKKYLGCAEVSLGEWERGNHAAGRLLRGTGDQSQTMWAYPCGPAHVGLPMWAFPTRAGPHARPSGGPHMDVNEARAWSRWRAWSAMEADSEWQRHGLACVATRHRRRLSPLLLLGRTAVTWSPRRQARTAVPSGSPTAWTAPTI
jgi:hypothetical protein